MTDKLIELQISEDSLHIISKELQRLRSASLGGLSAGEIIQFEKLIKIYAVTISARKQATKLGDLSDEDLQTLGGDLE